MRCWPLCVGEIHLPSRPSPSSSLRIPWKRKSRRRNYLQWKQSTKRKRRNKRIFERHSEEMDGEELHLFDSNASRRRRFCLFFECEKHTKQNQKEESREKGFFISFCVESGPDPTLSRQNNDDKKVHHVIGSGRMIESNVRKWTLTIACCVRCAT